MSGRKDKHSKYAYQSDDINQAEFNTIILSTTST